MFYFLKKPSLFNCNQGCFQVFCMTLIEYWKPGLVQYEEDRICFYKSAGQYTVELCKQDVASYSDVYLVHHMNGRLVVVFCVVQNFVYK